MKKLAKINPLITVAVTFVIILVTQLIFFTIRGKDQFQLLTDQIEKYQHNEILLENNIRLLNDKANEVRSILSLPEIVLNQSNTDNDSKTNENINDNLPFYNAIDFIQVYSDKTSMENMLHILLTSGRMNENLNSLGFIIKKTGSSSYNFFRSNSLYFNIKAENPESPSISIKSFTGNTKNFLLKEILTDDTEIAEFINSEIPGLVEHYLKYNEFKINFVNLVKNKDFKDFLKIQNLEISEIENNTNKLYYIIHNKDKSFSLNIYLDRNDNTFEIEQNKFSDYNEFYKLLKQSLTEADKRTKEIKVVDITKLKVESVLSEDSFISYLEQNSLNIKLLPREDNDYFYYDIIEDKNNILGSFAVQKIIGDIYLMDPDDIMISSLKYLKTTSDFESEPKAKIEIPDNLPQIIDKYSNTNSSTFVVIGSHENNADTIILVHADGISGKVTLIAVPRDLYYQENKINAYYRTYGGEKFIEVLSDITGLSIEGYIAVDMYAFIDLINILGGIDITLEGDLIDPTYMVRDNGEWSTLYYKKGTHHLNGIESLRIARSRHTSSDFGRTSRQQLVIKGIKDKMSALDITDLGTILELFRTLENYLDTNLSSMEMLSLFIKYKDSDLNRKQGLSTFNVLYNTYTNIYKLEDKSKQYEEGFYRGYWILLPQKNDWNVIKWYIRSLIEEE